MERPKSTTARRFVRTPRRKEFLLVAFSTVLTLAFIEIGFRLFAPQYGNYVQPDDVIEYSFVPGARYTFVARERCPGWDSTGRMNSHGLRDQEYNLVKGSETFRILALGDSYTEAFQVDLEKSWPKLLERRLNARGGALKYEVINAGRSAMGTGTEYLYYINKGRSFTPDLVLVLFIPNDFRDNSSQLNNRLQPYFSLSRGQLQLDNSFSGTLDYQLRKFMHPLKYFYLVSFTATSYRQIEAQLREFGRDEDVHRPALTANEQTAVEITKRLLVELSRAVTRHGGRFAILIGTANYEVNFNDLQESDKTHDFLTSNADQIIVTLAQRVGFPYLNLEPVMREYSTRHRELIHGCIENSGGGHWSETGHTVAASAIYEFLINQALIPTKHQ